MTETEQKTESQPSTKFRKIVIGGSLIFLASVAEQLFFVYDDPQILSSIGGPVRLAQSASDIAIQKVLASAHGDPSR